MKRAAAAMALLFAFAAALQVNDPDPLPWLLLYGAAALQSALAAARGPAPRLAGVACCLYVGLALAWLPALLGARVEAFDSFEMASPADEEAREALGIWICALWSCALLAWARGGARSR